jgi:hypothetical protein
LAFRYAKESAAAAREALSDAGKHLFSSKARKIMWKLRISAAQAHIFKR